jgi:UDP-3-O-[3-hydroxymyristoyl] N-acetylglucosamine deacetylase
VIFKRKTLAAEVRLEGRGLHSGVPVVVTIRPSWDGIVFRHGQDRWAAKPENVTDTSRCTKLGSISTIEHLMSAFCGLEITDADVEVTHPEMPALDGAARSYVDALLGAGFTDGEETQLPNLFTRVFVQEPEAKIAISYGTGVWRYEFTTGDRWPGSQIFELEELPEGYIDEIAPARTFGFEAELPMIRQAGLAQGLDESTAFVIGNQGYVNAVKFPDEPARHKLLDAIGDLYLAGVPARFLNVVAERTGHRAHVQAAKILYDALHRPQS